MTPLEIANAVALIARLMDTAPEDLAGEYTVDELKQAHRIALHIASDLQNYLERLSRNEGADSGAAR